MNYQSFFGLNWFSFYFWAFYLTLNLFLFVVYGIQKRFSNRCLEIPPGIGLPDIDIDFADDRRADVIEYVRESLREGRRRADHYLRHVGREVGGARRGPGDGAVLWRWRPAGEDDSG